MMTVMIEPFKLGDVREALQQVDIAGINVEEGIRIRTGEIGEDAL